MTSRLRSHSHHDVIVVGSRCAGASTAMLLARVGHDVAVVDRSSFPSDTVSTHSIARGGVVQLARWGLLRAVLATPALESVRRAGAGAAALVEQLDAVFPGLAARRRALITSFTRLDQRARTRGRARTTCRDSQLCIQLASN